MHLAIQLLPKQASTVAFHVDLLYGFLVAISIFFTILIAVLVTVFAIKFRRRSEDEKPKAIEGNHLLELIWVGIPFLIVMTIFVWGTVLYFHMAKTPSDAIEIFGVGKQWMWKFQHPEGNREINDLHVPINKPVKVILTSEDVIHSFYVPAFRVKMDAVPGRYTTTWFEATEEGEYHLFCAEYCGTEHSRMIGTVYAMQQEDYEQWLMGDAGGSMTMASRGEKLFQELRCNSCHTSQSTELGPTLHGLMGSNVSFEDGGSVEVDEAYIRESIVNPHKRIVAGYTAVMPTYKSQVNEEDLLKIISYIKSLKGEEDLSDDNL